MIVFIQLGEQSQKGEEPYSHMGAVFGPYADEEVENAKKRLSKIAGRFLIIDGEIFSAKRISSTESGGGRYSIVW